MLEVDGLSAFYGPAQALFDVSLHIKAGEFVVLQGLNGAGKSTLLKAVMGMEVKTRGSVRCNLDAASIDTRLDISDWPTHRRAQAGLGYVAEDRRLFTGLSVLENLTVVARGDALDDLRGPLGTSPPAVPDGRP